MSEDIQIGTGLTELCAVNRFWNARKHGPQNYTAVRNDGETRFYFSREALERDFGPLVFSGESPSAIAGDEPVGVEAGHPEAICEDCHGPNVVWFAPSPIWNKVARPEDGPDPMLCPRCFIRRAEVQGYHAEGAWRVEPEFYDRTAESQNSL